MSDRMTAPWGEYTLTRFPEDPREPLRAWDASDAYLLRHLAESGTPLDGAVVVVGDRWGALTTALGRYGPTQITDSYLSREATRANLERAGVGADAVRLLTTRDTPADRVDVLLVRVPKSLALLEDQLHRLAPAVHEGTVVIGTGMVKEIHTSTLRLFERILGPTRTSLARQKARLIFCTPERGVLAARGGDPWPYTYRLPDDVGVLAGRTVVNHAGVFCADRLDIGTRFFLRHLPKGPGGGRVVDLGCGNGVVGTAVALADPGAEVVFVDESYQAVASAEATYRANRPGADDAAEFRVGDGLEEFPPGSVDLVLNNPPFHSHQATTDATARRMFAGARRALRPGGELWVVGNRHLRYHVTLRRIFGNSEVVAGDAKFVVLKAVRRG
ncbi:MULTISPECIES: methyltransferase [Streptomyces]|uniref:Ribosomal RNA large subunit methyltransferase G n=1 Tax=Streptomyces stelliscabiei TaxID=146820 RepID=A0A8I0NWN3_9ACTN|nr:MULTISPECIES: methyltransferase [Streptomyces]KND46533.1 50S rRNA methyltransferase [Streptomyces stelliscabiei]MBE1595046.1 16S rRNA (guanine1207-N2)-methyltransferase [Streptomyces stelliscabiei]MDX2516015.1 methyltransferase [Streptomyces stelliscabiei]MDX2552988.1 methyltransferase [Streptomyces stelliscabiei]MDX2611976.1 methyltransferase [Streptomyces stelliscabiei]